MVPAGGWGGSPTLRGSRLFTLHATVVGRVLTSVDAGATSENETSNFGRLVSLSELGA